MASESASSSSSIKALSLSSILSEQSRLLKQAARAIPHSFNQCTNDRGYIRQAIYLCKTCAGGEGKMGKGICAACSVSCHADHEQLELFPKRHFRCDCATSAVPVECTLCPPQPSNEENSYGPNFAGRFCRCDRPYDALTETETMVQCVVCEDWWHESCLRIRAPPPSASVRTPQTSPSKRGTVATSSPPPPTSAEPSSEADYVTDDDDVGEDEDDDDNLVLPGSAWNDLICGACASQLPPSLRRWAGTQDIKMIVRKARGSNPNSGKQAADVPGWEVLAETTVTPTAAADPSASPTTTTSTRKRSASPSAHDDEHPAAKRPRLENGESAPTASPASTCTAPAPNPVAQKVLATVASRLKAEQNPDMLMVVEEHADVEGEGDLFLVDGWRDRWCRCEQCLPAFENYPFLLKEEDTYTPPEDPDSKKSLEELGLRALNNLPRDKALDSIRAFNEMRDNLMEYLKPFAQEGKIVTDSDVTAFFAALKEGKTPAAL